VLQTVGSIHPVRSETKCSTPVGLTGLPDDSRGPPERRGLDNDRRAESHRSTVFVPSQGMRGWSWSPRQLGSLGADTGSKKSWPETSRGGADPSVGSTTSRCWLLHHHPRQSSRSCSSAVTRNQRRSADGDAGSGVIGHLAVDVLAAGVGRRNSRRRCWTRDLDVSDVERLRCDLRFQPLAAKRISTYRPPSVLPRASRHRPRRTTRSGTSSSATLRAEIGDRQSEWRSLRHDGTVLGWMYDRPPGRPARHQGTALSTAHRANP
jgi:hypothetical protein